MARDFEYINSVNLHKLQSKYYYPSFTENETEAQESVYQWGGAAGTGAWQPNHKLLPVWELGFEFWLCLASKF